jgi:hypothetical protein
VRTELLHNIREEFVVENEKILMMEKRTAKKLMKIEKILKTNLKKGMKKYMKN